jgi:malate synthase
MSISWCAPDGRLVELDRDSTTVMIRPRGLHQTERHYSLGGAPISGSFFDFGLFIWHNGQDLVRRESGPYICLAKLENRLEARLWNDIFTATETALGLPPCSIRATVGIDSVLAGFEMEEILYELRDRVTALSLGRANYLFSVAKKFGKHPEFVLPDGDYQTAVPMIDAVDTLMVQMCHRRGAHAIGDVGGLVADHASGRSTARAMEILRRRVLRDAEAGHDGVLVSDPEFCGFARTMLDEKVSGANQLAVLGRLNPIGATDLLRAPSGEFQYAALRRHTETAIHQLSSWLRGGGLVRRQDAMLNSATTELSRSLLWQWYHHRVLTSDGCILTPGHWQTCLDEVVTAIYESVGADRFTEDHYDVAARLMRDLVVDPDFVQFFPLRAGIHLSAE